MTDHIVAVEDLRPGDLVNLENDPYADPFGSRGEGGDEAESDHMYYECEYAVVEEVEQETPDCTLVHFDNSSVGFPHGHLLEKQSLFLHVPAALHMRRDLPARETLPALHPAERKPAVNAYAPRRQSKRWLDGDCPREILAIYYDKREPSDPYTIFYADVDRDNRDVWFTYMGASEDGRYYHGQLRRHETQAFRYRNAHRARKWSEVHEPVRRAVLAEIAELRKENP